MTAAARLRGEGAGAALRWGACFLLVLGLHAGLAVALLRRAPRPELAVSVPDAVMVELAPDTAPQPDTAPAADPRPAPEPQLPEALSPPQSALVEPPVATEPPPPPEPVVPPIPALPSPTVALPEPLPPAPKRPALPRPARPPRPVPASPPRPAAEPPPSAAPASAPPPAASAVPSSSALPGWRSELAGRLQRAKRYPDVARAREEQGAATVTLTLDRSGHVLSVKLVRSSGSPSLDEEAVALVRRADPLPPMPADVAGNTITFTLPITFFLR